MRDFFQSSYFKPLAIIIVVLIAFLSYNRRDKSNSRTGPSRDYQKERLAYIYVKEEVKRNLKSPSTANFPGIIESKNHIVERNNGIIEINSWVDSQNSFGAIVRMNYKSTLKCTNEYCQILTFNFIE